MDEIDSDELANDGGNTLQTSSKESEHLSPQEKSSSSRSQPEDIPDPIRAILQDMPPGSTREIRQALVSMQSGPRSVGPDALIERMPPEQCLNALETILSLQTLQIENDFKFRTQVSEREERHTKRQTFVMVGLIALVVIIGVVALWKGNTTLATHLFTAFASLIAGAFGGYGYSKKER